MQLTGFEGRHWLKMAEKAANNYRTIDANIELLTLIAEAYDHEYLTMNIDKKHTKMSDCMSIVFQVENIAPACNSI